MRAIDPAHFPNVVAALREAGLDPTRELIPVAPAAHYMMGGIVTDLTPARRSPACTRSARPPAPGLHGANRLASNSLSECFVFARRAVADALAEPRRAPRAGAGRGARRCASCRRRRAADARDPRGAVARRRHRAHAEGLERLLGDPHPLAA